MSDIVSGTVLSVDLGSLRHNWLLQKNRLGPGVECAAVVKGNAFGCGLVEVSSALAQAGCRTFFVATPVEALKLRSALPSIRIAVLNGLLGAEHELARHGIVPVLSDMADIARWQEAARMLGRRLEAFLQVNTGLNRLGLDEQQFQHLTAHPPEAIDFTHLMSHLACSSDPDAGMNEIQRMGFEERLALMRKAGMPVRASLADSGAILLGSRYHFDLVRPGISLFGGSNIPDRAEELLAGIRPVVALKARVVQVREVAPPETIGYSCRYKVAAPMRIAVASIGFADGLPRSPGPRVHGLVAGHKAPIIGNLSMDLTVFDVSKVPAQAVHGGSWIELFGPDYALDRFAADANTVPDEILAHLGQRVLRIYSNAA